MIKIKERLNSFLTNLLKKNDSQSKFMLGSIFLDNAKKKYESIKDLNEVEFKVFSQTGEDGIIDFLISKLGILNSKFVEIGVGDYSEANTRYIYEKSFSKGLIIDIEKDFKRKVSKNINLWKGLLEIENIEISTENINKILDKYHLNEKLDLFSIDIDGIDYWVIENTVLESYSGSIIHKGYCLRVCYQSSCKSSKLSKESSWTNIISIYFYSQKRTTCRVKVRLLT